MILVKNDLPLFRVCIGCGTERLEPRMIKTHYGWLCRDEHGQPNPECEHQHMMMLAW